MSAKVDAQSVGKLDSIKWAVAVLALVAGLGGFYYFANTSVLVRVIALLISISIAVMVAAKTIKGRKIWQFIQDTHLEVRKVVWPSRQETVQTTGVVIVMVIVMALMIWAVDSFLFWLVQKLTT
jgi:preprotein translocase subunit SecE